MEPVFNPSRAQISRAAIQRLYIAMRHLLLRGSYKPLGVSGEAMIDALLDLKPEIYGSIADSEKVELKGLLYIFQRLPQGISECRYIKLISREGYQDSSFKAIVPAKRRRQCYRLDKDQMVIEMTRGMSDVYDIMTHLTFLYIEAEKIGARAIDHRGRLKRDWLALEEIVTNKGKKKPENKNVGYTYLSALLGRTYEETAKFADIFEKANKVNSLFSIVYWMGRLSIQERLEKKDREIDFSSTLREKVGFHIYGTIWAQKIKRHLFEHQLLDRPIHIISANLHSVMNCFFAKSALRNMKDISFGKLMQKLSKERNKYLRGKIQDHALKNGMIQIEDNSGMNIGVQIFDTAVIPAQGLPHKISTTYSKAVKDKKVIIVMDYAFGEQAYECMDELLKPYEIEEKKIPLNIQSINIMGKAGILEGDKGDIMIPDAHVFEGSTDNYPFNNKLSVSEFKKSGLSIFKGPMITVLGTSLQNKDILRYFSKSSWKGIGLEMEGAHYQKAIQVACCIRHHIKKSVALRYAYYASDNPLKTGSTLASGGLGVDGVKPTYTITKAILKGIFSQ